VKSVSGHLVFNWKATKYYYRLLGLTHSNSSYAKGLLTGKSIVGLVGLAVAHSSRGQMNLQLYTAPVSSAGSECRRDIDLS
jgi:hypothetical protein